MQSYKVYFLDHQDHIFAVDDIDAPDDEAAIDRASDLCASNPNCAAVEVWQRDRLLQRHRRAAA